MTSELIIIRQLPDNYQFVSDSWDVDAIKAHFGNGSSAQDYDSFFVLTKDGDYVSVYGMYGIVPLLSKLVRRIK